MLYCNYSYFKKGYWIVKSIDKSKVSQADLKTANTWEGIKTGQSDYVCTYRPAGCADPKYVLKK